MADPPLVGSPELLPLCWKDCKSIYPSFTKIVTVLQDLGVVDTRASKTKAAKQTGALIDKLALGIVKRIKELYPNCGLGSNNSRGKETLTFAIITKRRHVDTHDAKQVFHAHGSNGKVYMIMNDKLVGLGLAVESFQEITEAKLKSAATNRTPKDGLQCAYIMLDPKHRQAVAGIMKNKKDRKKSDVPGDPTLHFFEEAINDFDDIDFEPQLPPEDDLNRLSEDLRNKYDAPAAAAGGNSDYPATPEDPAHRYHCHHKRAADLSDLIGKYKNDTEMSPDTKEAVIGELNDERKMHFKRARKAKKNKKQVDDSDKE